MRVALWSRSTERQAHPLATVQSDTFILFTYHEKKGTFSAYNDRSGHNPIFLGYDEQTGTHTISHDIPTGYSIRPYAVGESLFFHSVKPPYTMYDGVAVVPMASSVTLLPGVQEKTYIKYWDVVGLFEPKATDYDAHALAEYDASSLLGTSIPTDR